jgi:hypothetical protein
MSWSQCTQPKYVVHAATKWVACASIVFLAMACNAGTSTDPSPMPPPDEPSKANPLLTPLVQPPQYALWWEMTKSCSGLGRDVSGVRFYSVPAGQLRAMDAGTASIAGNWNAATNSITLSNDALASPTIVRHEMLHALLVAGGHPVDKFVRECGDYVNCEGACAQEAEQQSRPDVNSRLADVAELEITQRLVPSVIDFAADPDGWFALIVEVRNPANHAVQVRLKPFPGRADISATLGYAGERASHQEYVEGSLLPLQPGEVRRAVFDLRARDYLAQNSSGRIRGFFNADSLPPLTLSYRAR